MGAERRRRPAEMIQNGLSDSRHGGFRRWTADSFFPPRCCEAPGLEESVGHHGHERVSMQSGPGAPLEVVEAELLLELLVRLFANPARLDGSGQGLEIGLRRQVGQVVLAFARRAMLADEPDRLARGDAGSPSRRFVVSGRPRLGPGWPRSGPSGDPWCHGASSPFTRELRPGWSRPRPRPGRRHAEREGDHARQRGRSSRHRPGRPCCGVRSRRPISTHARSALAGTGRSCRSRIRQHAAGDLQEPRRLSAAVV